MHASGLYVVHNCTMCCTMSLRQKNQFCTVLPVYYLNELTIIITTVHYQYSVYEDAQTVASSVIPNNLLSIMPTKLL